MAELGEATLQVSYKGAEISAQILEKLFASILREIEKSGAQETEKTRARTAKTIADAKAVPWDEKVHTATIDRAAAELKGEGVSFHVLKQPGKAPGHTLVFKGKDIAAIEKALKSLTDDRTIERTPERPGLNPQEPQKNGRSKENTRIFTGKSLQEDIRMAKEAVALRNAQRAKTRAPKAPDRGLDR